MAGEFKIKNGAIVSGSITGITESLEENSSKMASTSWVRDYINSLNLPTGSTVKSSQSFTATEQQTVFTISGGYTPGLIDVFVNGVYLNSSAVTALNGTTIVLSEAAVSGDIVDVIILTSTGLVTPEPVAASIGIKEKIAEGETLTVQEDYQYNLVNQFTVLGTVNMNGTLNIL